MVSGGASKPCVWSRDAAAVSRLLGPLLIVSLLFSALVFGYFTPGVPPFELAVFPEPRLPWHRSRALQVIRDGQGYDMDWR
jgi:hypothetical protein